MITIICYQILFHKLIIILTNRIIFLYCTWILTNTKNDMTLVIKMKRTCAFWIHDVRGGT